MNEAIRPDVQIMIQKEEFEVLITHLGVSDLSRRKSTQNICSII